MYALLPWCDSTFMFAFAPWLDELFITGRVELGNTLSKEEIDDLYMKRIAELDEQLEDAEYEKQKLELENVEQNMYIEELTEELEETKPYKQECSKLEKVLEEKDNSINNKNKEVSRVKEEREELQQKNKTLSNQLEEALKKINTDKDDKWFKTIEQNAPKLPMERKIELVSAHKTGRLTFAYSHTRELYKEINNLGGSGLSSISANKLLNERKRRNLDDYDDLYPIYTDGCYY